MRFHRVNQKRLHSCLTLLVCAACMCMPRVFSAEIDKPTLEYQVKASLIFNLLHYIEFPASVDQPQNEITICFDDFALYGSAVKALEGELVSGKSIRIRHFNLAESQQCNVVVFSGAELPNSQINLQALAQDSILTIGEHEDFLQKGGIVRFGIIESTVQFDINQHQAKQARISISSKLLRLARVVVATP